MLADNRTALDAGWDNDLLKIELQDLDAAGFDLALTGFDIGEIEALTLDETEGLTDEDAVPDAPAVPVTVLGDVWLLGRHRLMCGDSTSIDAVERLMDGQKADMVFTDPPYGIAYSSDKFDGNKAGVTNKRNKAEMIQAMKMPLIHPSWFRCLRAQKRCLFGGSNTTLKNWGAAV